MVYFFDMKYYAVQVRTTREENYISALSSLLECRNQNERFIFPKRKLPIRRAGKTTMELKPIFPGYIFIEAEDIDPQLYNAMRHVKGFFRFLPSNQSISALAGKDLVILKHFISFGNVIESSKVIFDENDRILVKSGPLNGLEGLIVKVDRRKKRAKIKLDFANESFLLDLAFDIIEKDNGTQK